MTGEPRQTVTVAVDDGGMVPVQEWSTLRKNIDEHGALNIGDGFGVISIAIGGRRAVTLRLHEDRMHHVVLDVIDALTNEKIGTVQPELYDLVPPRRTSAPKKERRFGDG
ncbi:hypothetical protein SEA_MARCIE_86 [Microbacterium phage Marcie]|nr:hypothetical protein SEA_MARCIE_86 [Microbacterium phage Marcie]